MIVELFGPPGVGKTTFAAALTASLRERGCAVETIVSYRPAEQSPSSGIAAPGPGRRAVAAVRRVARPIAETLGTLRGASADEHEVGTPAGLIRLLPPKNLMWSIRLHQYLLRLFRSWSCAASADHVVLFDQAFVQAVCSLAVLARAPEWQRIVSALDAVPKPDLLVQLGAAPAVLEARLRERQQRQSRMEQLLELDVQTNLRFIGVAERLSELLRDRGQPVTSVDSTGPGDRREAVARTEAAILAGINAARAVTA